MRHGTSSLARTLAAVGLAILVAPVAATASYAGARQEGPIKVVGTATNVFDPVDITAAPNAKGEISIEFVSEGAPHTIQSNDVPGFDSGNVDAGKTKTVTFKAPAAGQYKVICLYHESVGMIGTLTVTGGTDTEPSASAEPSSQPPASASASASVGAPDDNAPTEGAEHEGEAEEGHEEVPGVEGNKVLHDIELDRAAQEGAVSGFKFFTFVCVAFLFILGAAVLFSTRPRRAGR